LPSLCPIGRYACLVTPPPLLFSSPAHTRLTHQDFIGIVLLLFINSAIGFHQERSAGNAVKALMDSLTPKAKVKRSGSWSEIEPADLVPGDMISFKIGDIVPSDCRLTEAINVLIDQTTLTGKLLSQSKKHGDECFS
jgi:H+-transporting ATPase